jgi:hypothetical protein
MNQSETGTVPTAHVRSEEAAGNRARDAISWPIADGTNYSADAGTLTVSFTAGFDSADIPVGGVIGLVSTRDNAVSILYLTRPAAALRLYSANTSATIALNISEFSKGDTITFKSTWSAALNKANIYTSVDGWHNSGGYDPFTLGTHWRVGYSSAYPFDIKDITVTNTFDKDGL